jgi:predicted ATPase
MIKKLQIQNFKCFLNQTIDFGQITVLAGANGVGKSSLIQALLLLHRAYQTVGTLETEHIAINDKEKTFLELGTTKEIINSNATERTIYFDVWNEQDEQERVVFEMPSLREVSAKILNQPTILSQQAVVHDTRKFFRYLNAERLGPRNTQTLTNLTYLHTGFQGEFTGQAIKEATDFFQFIPKQQQIIESNNFFRQVEAWLNFVIPDIEINPQPYEDISQVRMGIKKIGSETEFLHPNNIGFGITYALPIIVSGLIAEEGSILIVENPEAHLHPFGQSRMGQFLAQMAGAGIQVIVETHSEHIINGIRLASLKNKINYQDVIVNFFNQEKGKEVQVQAIQMNEKAELDDYPRGFFDQEEDDLAEIFRLTRKKI